MNSHKNARTTVHGRMLLVKRVQAGVCPSQVAAELGISLRTVRKWLARFRAEGEAGLKDRSSCAHLIPHRLAAPTVDVIVRLRREFKMTARGIAHSLKLARSTVAGILKRLGLGRLKLLEPKEPVKRYERKTPGELIHLDIKKLGRFNRPGHRVTGRGRGRSRHAGWEYVHICIDDCSRVAYVERLPDETGASTTAFLQRATAWFAGQGIKVQRVMTDNGSGYKANLFKGAVAVLGMRHIYTRPYTPKTNGKAERFIQTLLREWAYGRAYATSEQRADHLPGWLSTYNHHRPHGSLNHQPPISRLRAASEQPT